MTETTEPKKKVIRLRISPKTVEEVREKAGEDSVEFQFLKTLMEANVPYSVLSAITKQPQDQIRDCITCRRVWTAPLKELICVKMKKVLDTALDIGILPCNDPAVIKPIVETVTRNIGVYNMYNNLKAQIEQQQGSSQVQ